MVTIEHQEVSGHYPRFRAFVDGRYVAYITKPIIPYIPPGHGRNYWDPQPTIHWFSSVQLDEAEQILQAAREL